MSTQNKAFPVKQTLNCGGKLLSLARPVIMGVLNVTPDSFYDGGKFNDEKAMLLQVEKMISEGAAIIDVGGMSSRPGAEDVSVEDELKRTIPVIQAIITHFPQAIISIDTYRSKVAEEAVQHGASIINDISGGGMEAGFIEAVTRLRVPYILMHMRGKPQNMQVNPVYNDVVPEVMEFFKEKLFLLKDAGINDIVIDPGFGFGKNVEHNFSLLKHLSVFQLFGCPIMTGVSRKSMINKVLKTPPAKALNGTTVLNTLALANGCSILRVHDVLEAKQAIDLWNQYDAAV
jgi:dihydropteroate synthase